RGKLPCCGELFRAPAAEMISSGIGGNGIEPGLELGFRIEAPATPKEGQEGRLGEIFRILGPHPPAEIAPHRLAIPLVELVESAHVSLAKLQHQRFVRVLLRNVRGHLVRLNTQGGFGWFHWRAKTSRSSGLKATRNPVSLWERVCSTLPGH